MKAVIILGVQKPHLPKDNQLGFGLTMISNISYFCIVNIKKLD